MKRLMKFLLGGVLVFLISALFALAEVPAASNKVFMLFIAFLVGALLERDLNAFVRTALIYTMYVLIGWAAISLTIMMGLL